MNRDGMVRVGGFALMLLGFLVSLGGCTAVNTFPMAARPGDTISVMVGGSEQVRKGSISAILTDAAGGQYDLQALGLVRSVFNLRADGPRMVCTIPVSWIFIIRGLVGMSQSRRCSWRISHRTVAG